MMSLVLTDEVEPKKNETKPIIVKPFKKRFYCA